MKWLWKKFKRMRKEAENKKNWMLIEPEIQSTVYFLNTKAYKKILDDVYKEHQTEFLKELDEQTYSLYKKHQMMFEQTFRQKVDLLYEDYKSTHFNCP